MRVQTLESMFVMWRTTGDARWREHGWTIWEAVENQTRTSSAYASIQGVDKSNPFKMDSMPRYGLMPHFSSCVELIASQLLFVRNHQVCVPPCRR